MIRHLIIAAVAMSAMSGCATHRPQHQSFFGGEQGKVAPAREDAPPPVEGPSEYEVDTGFGIAVTPPESWDAGEPAADGGMVMTSTNGSIVRLEAFVDGGDFLDRVKKWHEDFGKLASSTMEPLAEAELAGTKAWTAKYQFIIDNEVVSQSIWELPHNGHFYRIHVGVASVGDRYETQTILDSLRFVPVTHGDVLHDELLGASIDNPSLGKTKISPGWQKSANCVVPGCAIGWVRDDAVMVLLRRDFASAAAAAADVPLWVSRYERLTGSTPRPAKYGKNSGYVVEVDDGRIWFGAFNKSIWTLKLDASPTDVRRMSKSFERAIAGAHFK